MKGNTNCDTQRTAWQRRPLSRASWSLREVCKGEDPLYVYIHTPSIHMQGSRADEVLR